MKNMDHIKHVIGISRETEERNHLQQLTKKAVVIAIPCYAI
jgi:hypothetical protein